MPLRVTSVTWKSELVREIELRHLEGETLPPFTAGSHVDLHLPTGLVRSYSLMNSQADRLRYLLGIARDPASRGGSVFVHDHLRVGHILRVGQPRNLFKLIETAPAAVLIAGGIGVTPLISMAARLAELGRDWTLTYAVRARREAAFLRDLEIHGDRVRLHCDDERGGVLDLSVVIKGAPEAAHFYCCGPKPMMRAFGALTEALDPARVHVEHFAPLETAAVQGGFLVELARTGRTIAVPEGSTILEALTNAGIPAASSCQQGTCGTCEVGVLAGLPDHRDSILTASERAANKTMMVCCSGSLSERLVLDI